MAYSDQCFCVKGLRWRYEESQKNINYFVESETIFLCHTNIRMRAKKRRVVTVIDEIKLIKRIQKRGDRQAADALIRSYYDEIHRYVRKQTPGDDSALDLTQEIFISMLNTISHYDPKKGAGFRTWLYKIATNKTIDYFRSRSTRITETLSLDGVEPIDETDFAKQIENADFVEKVCHYVGGFPPDTQKIFRLHIFGGYTFAEIAESMQMAEGSVKSKYYRLINKIRGEFSE